MKENRWFDKLTMTFVILSLSKDEDTKKTVKEMEDTEGRIQILFQAFDI